MSVSISAEDARRRIIEGKPLRGKCIIGDLVLSGIGKKGAPMVMPLGIDLSSCDLQGALRIENCHLVGALVVDYCSMHALSVFQSRITEPQGNSSDRLPYRVSARNARINGDVQLQESEFGYASIKGIWIEHEGDEPKLLDSYNGIDFTGAVVGGHLYCNDVRHWQPGVPFGLGLQCSKVAGNVRVVGENSGFDLIVASDAIIGANAQFHLAPSKAKSSKGVADNKASGIQLMQRLQVSGSLTISGGEPSKLLLSQAKVSGNVNIVFPGAESESVESTGIKLIDFSAIDVGKSLSFTLGKSKKPGRINQIMGKNANIAGDFSVDFADFVVPDAFIPKRDYEEYTCLELNSASVGGDIAIRGCVVRSNSRSAKCLLDVYDAKANTITADDIRVAGYSKLDLGNVNVTSLVAIDEVRTIAGSPPCLRGLELRLNYAQAGAIRMKNVAFESISAKSVRVLRGDFIVKMARVRGGVVLASSVIGEGVAFEAVQCANLDLSGVTSNGAMVFKEDRAQIESAFQQLLDARVINEKVRDSLLVVFNATQGETFDETFYLDQLLAQVDDFELIDPIYSRAGSVKLTQSSWKDVDLQGLFIWDGTVRGEVQPAISASVDVAKLSAEGVAVGGVMSIRGDRIYPFAIAGSGLSESNTAVKGSTSIDLSGAEIREILLLEPRPSPIRLTGARIQGWGIDVRDSPEEKGRKKGLAERYDEILRCASLESDLYLRIEEQLENEGESDEADKLHVFWKRRQRERLGKYRRIISYCHDWFVAYGTNRTRLVLIATGMIFVCGLVVALSYDRSVIAPSASVLATLKECGVPCDGMARPQLSESAVGKVFDSFALAIDHGVPIVSLPLRHGVEPVAGTWVAHLLLILAVVGWVIWPVIVASALRGFFPKRYKSG